MPVIDIQQQITFLYTSDLASTADFYEKVLGFELALDQGVCRIYRVCTNGYLGFCQREGIQPERDNVIFTMITPQVDEMYDDLKARGVVFEKPPELNPKFNIYHCFFRDPNGYLFEIQKFLDPAWPERVN
jgi:catechol 2,3-dioxygenase-like lactoylglutathione lyase family enzyme